MPNDIISILGVNLNKYPRYISSEKMETLNNNFNEFTIGDLHANALKLLHFLINHAGAEITNAAYESILAIYNKKDLTKDDIANFDGIIEAITFNNNGRPLPLIRLIGDELSDRGQNDYFILKILEKMHRGNVPTEIIFSNHALEFVLPYEKILKKNAGTFKDIRAYNIGYGQDLSLINLGKLVKAGFVSDAKIIELVDNYYLPKIKLISYSMNHDGDRLTLHSHAPMDLVRISHLATHLGITYEASTVDKLLNTINQINTAFQKHLFENTIHVLAGEITPNKLETDPFLLILWGRDFGLNFAYQPINGVILEFVHGHDSGKKTSGNRINLDDNWGKGFNCHEGQYLILAGHNNAIPRIEYQLPCTVESTIISSSSSAIPERIVIANDAPKSVEVATPKAVLGSSKLPEPEIITINTSSSSSSAPPLSVEDEIRNKLYDAIINHKSIDKELTKTIYSLHKSFTIEKINTLTVGNYPTLLSAAVYYNHHQAIELLTSVGVKFSLSDNLLDAIKPGELTAKYCQSLKLALDKMFNFKDKVMDQQLNRDYPIGLARTIGYDSKMGFDEHKKSVIDIDVSSLSDEDIAEKLLAACSGDTKLLECHSNIVKLVKKLTDKSILNRRDFGFTLLERAIFLGSYSLINLFIEHGATLDIDTINAIPSVNPGKIATIQFPFIDGIKDESYCFYNLLSYALEQEEIKKERKPKSPFIDQFFHDIHILEKVGAAITSKGSLNEIKTLIDSLDDINILTKFVPNLPYKYDHGLAHAAVAHNRLDIAKYLIEKGDILTMHDNLLSSPDGSVFYRPEYPIKEDDLTLAYDNLQEYYNNLEAIIKFAISNGASDKSLTRCSEAIEYYQEQCRIQSDLAKAFEDDTKSPQSIEMITALIKRLDYELVNIPIDGCTLLQQAIVARSIELVDSLMQRGATILSVPYKIFPSADASDDFTKVFVHALEKELKRVRYGMTRLELVIQKMERLLVEAYHNEHSLGSISAVLLTLFKMKQDAPIREDDLNQLSIINDSIQSAFDQNKYNELKLTEDDIQELHNYKFVNKTPIVTSSSSNNPSLLIHGLFPAPKNASESSSEELVPPTFSDSDFDELPLSQDDDLASTINPSL